VKEHVVQTTAMLTLSGGIRVLGYVAENVFNFFEGASYTPKVLKQMQGGVGEFHSFPESVTTARFDLLLTREGLFAAAELW